MKTSIRFGIYTPNWTVDTHFVYFGPILPVSRMKMLVVSGYYVQVTNSQPYPNYFEITHSKIETNIIIMNVHSKWYCLIPICLLCSNIASFRDEIVSKQRLLHISITTIPRLFWDHSLQNENKHQIWNVHTKWNCLTPILSTLVQYCQFQGWKC